jgi:hypothetical protein
MKTIQLNSEVLQNLYGGCEESKTEVFTEFLSAYADLKQNLFSAYEAGSLDTMKSLLHNHGATFMYLGVPEVSDFFKKLEIQCSKIQDPHSISADFFRLLQMVDDTRLQVYNQVMYYKKAG